MGIVIAARELGKTSEKWNRMRYFVGRWRKRKAVICGKEEDESRDGGFVRIEEELKAGEVGKPPSFIDKFLNNKVQRVDRCNDHCNDRCDD
ncbi:hypothetical protein L249_1944 [Ophiocordyceps polyrhachis-furcata BCC 54312]|uniref:Uncharacterized protein n=1 Tax=Ophiocordyceps polyrhachis-furcata BCC 54312 TaxID=1330021 RepID=A0A367LRM9_9HYPO|nr:hypothetical protein L249_1944 [Ophiocordyceps polyrhachis-furcata BCC 54312]